MAAYEPDQRIVRSRFDDDWGGPAAFERVIVRNIPDPGTLVLELEAGTVDLILFTPPSDVVAVGLGALAGVALAAAGVTGRAVDRAWREPIMAAGYAEDQMHGYAVGHGLGLEVHEDPFLSEGHEGVLEEGMVVTIEPGVYLKGETGVRIEDTVRLTATGREVFDTTPRELLEL